MRVHLWLTPKFSLSLSPHPFSEWVPCATDYLSDARMLLQDPAGWTHHARPDIFLWRTPLKYLSFHLSRIGAHFECLQDLAGWTLLDRPGRLWWMVMRWKMRFAQQLNLEFMTLPLDCQS